MHERDIDKYPNIAVRTTRHFHPLRAGSSVRTTIKEIAIGLFVGAIVVMTLWLANHAPGVEAQVETKNVERCFDAQWVQIECPDISDHPDFNDRITEDDPRWDCETMGNRICGPIGKRLQPADSTPSGVSYLG